jgi:hypothetical protein
MLRTLVLATLLAAPDAQGASKANLRISKVVVTPSSTAVTFMVTVENAGGSSAAACSLDLFATPSTVPSAGETGDQRASIASLAAAKSTTVTLTVKGWTPEPEVLPDYVYFVVDSCKTVSESNESDNVVGQSLGLTSAGEFAASSLILKAQVPDIIDCPTCNEQPICPDCSGGTSRDGAMYPTTSRILTVHAPGRASTTLPSGWSGLGWSTGESPPF